MSVNTIQELFVDELRDIYHAEKQLVKALPKMAKAAAHPQLKAAFTSHLEETKGQVGRLEQVFELLDVSQARQALRGDGGVLEEAASMMEEVEDPQVLDVGMIVGAQKVEHYEIAGYGALVALATQLGHADAAKLLSQTLAEEKAADSKLNELALSVVNKDAAHDEGAVAEAPDAPGSQARQHKGRLIITRHDRCGAPAASGAIRSKGRDGLPGHRGIADGNGNLSGGRW